MKEISIEEQKQMQLDILSDIANFCEKNNLQYFLAYGTLIGAVRHQGYIPWDDDIDICMPEPDYDNFLAIYCSDIYKVIHNGNTQNYSVNFAKVHDERTRFQEAYSEENSYGVFVDVFPLHGYKNHWQWLKCQYALRLIRIKISVWHKQKSLYKNVANLICKFLLKIFPLSYLAKYREHVAREMNYEKAKYVHSFGGTINPFEKEWFNSYKKVLFEGRYYKIPEQYDKVLRTSYGNYMQLPPESERVLKHYAKVWWK